MDNIIYRLDYNICVMNAVYYRPQTKFGARYIFLHPFGILFTRGACMVAPGGVHGYSRGLALLLCVGGGARLVRGVMCTVSFSLFAGESNEFSKHYPYSRRSHSSLKRKPVDRAGQYLRRLSQDPPSTKTLSSTTFKRKQTVN